MFAIQMAKEHRICLSVCIAQQRWCVRKQTMISTLIIHILFHARYFALNEELKKQKQRAFISAALINSFLIKFADCT